MGGGQDEELLLRIWRRRTSLELTPQEIQEVEFEDEYGAPDLLPSVYAIDAAEVVQIVTEHSAGVGLDTVKNEPRGHLDLRSAWQGGVRETPGTRWFARARDAHRELAIPSEPELLAMIRRLGQCTRHPFAKADAKLYVQRKLNAGDVEWLDFTARARHGARYRKWAGL